MKKLLSLVLSVSIFISSVTPALGQALGGNVARRFVAPKYSSRVTKTAFSNNLYRQILAKTTNVSVRNVQMAALYQNQLKHVQSLLRVPHTQLPSFLSAAQKTPNLKAIKDVRNVLNQASALGLVGSLEQAPTLLNFYKQAQGTVFEDTAALITARGLLRMQAYTQLGAFLAQNAEKPILGGVAAYAQARNLPVEIPAALKNATVPAENASLASFLGEGFLPSRLHADPSAKATELWMEVILPQEHPLAQPVFAQADVSAASQQLQPEIPAQAEAISKETLFSQDIHLVVPQPGGAVNSSYIKGQSTARAVQPASKTENVSTSSSGILYSGIPVFSVLNSSKKVLARLRKKITKKEEDFDRTLFPVSVQSAAGVETKAPVLFNIGKSLPSAEYDRVVFREDPRFENGYIIELHDHGKDPIRMDHFYMALYNQDMGRLVKAAQQVGVSLRLKLEHTANVSYETVSKSIYSERTGKVLPLEVSVQLNRPLWSREMKQAFSHWLEAIGLPGTYSPNVLAEAKLVLRENGEIWMQPKGSSSLVPLPEEYYVRLPKNQVKNFVQMMSRLEGEPLNIVLSPTENRVNIVARDASLTNVSLGKTMGSIVNGSLGIAESHSKSLMFSINYVLPGFASLLTPVLKKYGEKNLLALSLGMSVSSGVLATLGGFYGFVENMTLDSVQKGLFVSAMLLMSGASILKQLVSNMLIRANRGEVTLSSASVKQAAAQVEDQTQQQAHGLALIAKRTKEFFTNKSEQSLRDIALYNLSFVYKNVGTLAFLSAPFLIEHGVKGLTGVDLGIDYSASFPLYAVYSSYVMWKILRSKLRDAYTAKNLIQSQQMIANMLKTGGEILATGPVNKAVIDDVARSFKDSLDALAFAHIKLDPSKGKKQLYNNTKEQVLAELEQNLINQHQLSAEQAKDLVEKVAISIKKQENNLGNMWKMIKAPGVPALTTAMTLATVHEFVISSSFSGMMKGLISEGELANFLIAASLYIPFIVGRLGGNWVSRRISKDSMYLLCSALSAVGTAIMATAGGSVSQAITGAAVASLGVGNFFTQMYDYIMTKYPKHNRELSSILALTMGIGGLGAIPAGYFASQVGAGIPVDLLYAGGMLAASLVLTPGMLKNSSIVKGIADMVRIPWKNLKTRVKRFFHRDGDEPPLLNFDW